MRFFQRKQKSTSSKDEEKQWPCPKYELEQEPQFLFIITPPYSGSTAIAQILNSAHGAAFLQDRAEGQWLVPGMCTEDRWGEHKEVDWDSVRAVWMKRVEFISSLVQDVDLIIEKSPPNMVRLEAMMEAFPRHTLMALNRNPYANSASILNRHYGPAKEFEARRLQLVRTIAEGWVSKSRWVRQWIEKYPMVHFNYEQFCASPDACIAKLVEELPVLKTVEVRKSIRVKDGALQGIVNMNAKQLENLSRREIEMITGVLSREPELVAFFDYELEE